MPTTYTIRPKGSLGVGNQSLEQAQQDVAEFIKLGIRLTIMEVSDTGARRSVTARELAAMEPSTHPRR